MPKTPDLSATLRNAAGSRPGPAPAPANASARARAIRAILRPGAGEPNAGGASCRPPESLRTAPCEPPAPGQNRPARLRAALSRAVAPAHHAAAGLLVIFAALLAVSTAAQAQTQTLTTFVSNTGETPESTANKILAQSFRTGDNADGYTLSEVQIWMAETAGKSTQARLKRSLNNEPYGTTVVILSNPSTLVANSLNTFLAPDITLDAETTYWITVNEGVSDSTRAQFATTFGDGESGAAGWSIGNTRLARESQTDDWFTQQSSLFIAIRGTTDTTNNAPVFADGRTTTRAFQEDIVPGSVFGDAITATDMDGDTLTYTLEGPDAALFTLLSSRRLRTKVGEDYSYETTPTHYLAIKADDNNGGIATIDVMVNVGDVEEQPDKIDKPTVVPVDNKSTELWVRWTKPGLGGGPAFIRHDVEVFGRSGGGVLDYIANGSAVAIKIGFLEANHEYTVRVRAVNGEIDGAWSETGAGKTNPVNDPPEFTDGSSTSRGFDENTGPGTAFGRTIDATDPDNDPVTYTVEGTHKALFDIDADQKLVTKAGTSFDHETKSEYSVKVAARDGDDRGGVARIDVTVNVRDVDEPPDAPEMPTVEAETGTSVSVTWIEPSTTGKPDIESYDVQYRKQGETPWTDGPQDIPSTTTTTEITGLDVATIYEAQVRATNDEGDGAWSEAGEGTTQLVPVTIEREYATIGAGLEDLVFTLTREGATTDELEATVTIVQERSWLTASNRSHTVTFAVDSPTATLTLNASIFSFDPNTSGDLTATVGGSGIAEDSATVMMISTADPPLTVRYDQSSYTFAENTAPEDVLVYVEAELDPAYPRAPSRTFFTSFFTVADTAGNDDYVQVSWQTRFLRADFAPANGGGFVARKRLAGGDMGAYFSVEDDDVYEGSERLVVSIDISPGFPFGIAQFAYSDGSTCVAGSSCTPTPEYEVIITDEEDRPVLSLGANPASIAEEDDSATTDVAENVSTLTVSATNGKTFATEQTITLTFAGTAVYGTHYSVSPDDTDGATVGHQVTLPALTASAPVIVTAAANDTGDGDRSIEVTGSHDGTDFATATIALPDDDTTTTTNTSPVFTDSATQARTLAETVGAATVGTAAAIGEPVAATDSDATDTLTYGLGGTDADTFTFDTTTGQIKTKAGESYDYEAQSSYSLTVTVNDGTVTESATVTINVTNNTTETPVAPRKPTVSSTSGNTTSLDVSWTMPTNTGRPAIDSYDLQYKKSTDNTWTAGPQDVGVTSAPIEGLAENTEYDVQVRATNADGDGPWSPSEKGTTGTTTNTAATGIPTISGTAQVGEILMALTSGISDADGLPSSFTYQWLRVDSDGTSNETDVGSNSNTYSPTAADVGKKIRVKVSFTDNAGNPEGPLTAAAYPSGAGTIAPATTTPPPDTNVLVSNTGEDGSGSGSGSYMAQSFTTGASATISQVQMGMTDTGKTTVVKIKEDNNGVPGTLVATLTNPGTLTVGLNTFTAPTGTMLAASTTYWITVNEGIATNKAGFQTTWSDTETGEPGWSIGNGRLHRSHETWNWITTIQTSLLIAVKGTTTGGTTASTDATLSGLALKDGDDTAITLSPGFAPATPRYTASVANRIDAVVLTATTNDSNATVAIASDDDTRTPGEAELDLNVGSNTLTVTVTAEDGSTTQDYTVTVTRAEKTANTPGVTVSETALTVTEQDTAGDSYTVVLDTQPTADVTVTVAGHAGTAVTPAPASLTFTASNWDTARTVTVTAGNDADTDDEMVSLTHGAASADADYQGIAIAGVAVTVSDNDAAVAAGICERTEEVRDELLRLIGTNEGAAVVCADVTAAHLAGVTGALDLSGRNIAALKAGDFAGLTGLTELYLYRNDLTSLPGGVFAGLASLEILVLARNGLTTLPRDVFDELGVLTELNLHNNDLTGLPAGVFDGLGALDVLTLNGNGLTTLPGGVFDRLGVLEVLNLDGNGLTTLPGGVFDRLAALKELTLHHNGLAELPGRVFEPLTALKDLRLRGNPGAPFAPTADAQPDDGTVSVDGGMVRLDGSGSGGPWGTNVSYSWTLTPSTSGVTFDDDTSAMPEVTIPPLAADIELTFTLTVTGQGGTDGVVTGADTATVRVTPAARAESPASPLTARFANVPGEHDGETAFTVEIVFDEAPSGMNNRALRAALAVTGGAVRKVRRVNLDRAHRIVTVRPDGGEAVNIALPASPDCDVAGALCTDAGGRLDAGLAIRVQGPPGLTVADAEVEEGPNASLAFAVTLDRAPTRTVTVDYATSDGTATAGADYTTTSGTLTFAAGETEKTVSVPVLDDAHDDGGEMLTLTFSNASGARIADDTATGTITNSDPMPRAFMARFGRTAAVHVIEQVQERIEAPREVGFEGQFAGRQLRPGLVRELAGEFLNQFAPSAGTNRAGADGHHPRSVSPASDTGAFATPGLADGTIMAADPMGGMPGTGNGLNPRGHFGRGFGGGKLQTGSAFVMNRETRRGGILSFWSRGAQSQFAGREGELSLGGRVRTTMFGADYATGPLVAGLSLSHSRGRGGYEGVDIGEVTSSVTGLYPWLGYQATDRITLWGVTGYGKGGLTLTPDVGAALKSGLSMAMAAGGLRGELADSVVAGFGLAFKANALWVGTGIEGVEGPGGNLAATSAAVTRYRTALEASRGYRFQRGLSLQPSLEVGQRRDGGDAETGAGVDIGGGLIVSDAVTGLSADFRVRMLLAHQDEEFRERGMSVSFGYNPTPSTPLGFLAKLTPSWGGQAESGAQVLWGRETMAGMADGGPAAGGRLEAELGYGMPVGGRLVGMPRFGIGTSDYGRDYRLGYGLTVAQGGAMRFDLGVYANRRESLGQGTAEHGVLGRLTARW